MDFSTSNLVEKKTSLRFFDSHFLFLLSSVVTLFKHTLFLHPYFNSVKFNVNDCTMWYLTHDFLVTALCGSFPFLCAWDREVIPQIFSAFFKIKANSLSFPNSASFTLTLPFSADKSSFVLFNVMVIINMFL